MRNAIPLQKPLTVGWHAVHHTWNSTRQQQCNSYRACCLHNAPGFEPTCNVKTNEEQTDCEMLRLPPELRYLQRYVVLGDGG